MVIWHHLVIWKRNRWYMRRLPFQLFIENHNNKTPHVSEMSFIYKITISLCCISLKITMVLTCEWLLQKCILKELEHRKMGWKVLILKYDLGKSLSKEMWCKMANTKTNFTTYFKRWKMHVIWGKSFMCPWTRKWIPLIMNGILEMSWFVHIFLQN